MRDSHDHHANTALDDLLQRLAAYKGAVIATTNPQGNIDAALARDESRPRRWRAVRIPRPRA